MTSNRIKILNYLLIVLLGSLISFLVRNFRLDDALIYYRYIENFINGNGLVYNNGEKFNALSSPLYVYISIFLSSLTREVEITQLVLNGVFVVMASLSLAYLFYYLNKPVIAFIFSIIYITSKFYYLTFGLESNLFVFLSLVCIILYFKKSYFFLSVCSALLILTRGEGLFLVLVLWGFVFYENRKSIKLSYVIIGAVIILPNHLFNYYYYGSLLPHTLTAKMSHGNSGLWDVNQSFLLSYNFMARMAFNNQAFFVLMLILFSIIGMVNHLKEKVPLILFLYSLGITIFHMAFNIQNYHWYYSIHFLTFLVLVTYGVTDVISFLNAKVNKPALRYLLLIMIFIYPALTQIELFRLLAREKPMDDYKTPGEWLRNNTPPDAKISCVEIGHVGWYSKRYIVDIVGLVNPQITDNLGKRKFDSWYELYKPDYLLTHDPLIGAELTTEKYIMNGTYREEPAYSYRGMKLYKRAVNP